MKLFVFLVILFTSFSSFAVENCTFGQQDMIVISWTGGCTNNSISGVGELRVIDIGYDSKVKIKRRIYGKFERGARVGLSVDLPYEQDNMPVSYQTGWFRFDDSNGNPSLIPVIFKAPDPNPEKIQDFTKVNWHPVVNNKPDYSKTLTFEQAFEEIKRYVVAQNSDSVDINALKNYLKGNNNLNLIDEPPVVGVRLSLSDASGNSNKPKKKSKKKQNN